jgi:hypothetical protein
MGSARTCGYTSGTDCLAMEDWDCCGCCWDGGGEAGGGVSEGSSDGLSPLEDEGGADPEDGASKLVRSIFVHRG